MCSSVGLVVFSAYSALSEAQLRGRLIVNERITMVPAYELLLDSRGLSVTSFLMVRLLLDYLDSNSHEDYRTLVLLSSP